MGAPLAHSLLMINRKSSHKAQSSTLCNSAPACDSLSSPVPGQRPKDARERRKSDDGTSGNRTYTNEIQGRIVQGGYRHPPGTLQRLEGTDLRQSLRDARR